MCFGMIPQEFVLQQEVRERAASIRCILDADDGAATAAEVLKMYLIEFNKANGKKMICGRRKV